LRNLDGVRKLWSGISSKKTDTTSTIIDRLGEFLRSNPFSIPDPFPVCPILTEKTVKGASVIKDGKIFISMFWTLSISKLRIAGTCPAWTDPICHTVGGKPVIIPAQIPLF
jgi:hypothetical protein